MKKLPCGLFSFFWVWGFWGFSPRRVVHGLLDEDELRLGRLAKAAAAGHSRREEAVGIARRRHAEGAVEVPLGAPAGLAWVQALARVRRHEHARLGVVVHVCPALRACQALTERSAELTLGVLDPLALGRVLVAV